jgi:hypothetical protein
MPELELELMEPLDGWRSELLVLEVLEVLEVLDVELAAEPWLDDVWFELDPGNVIASTTANTPSAPTPAIATPAVTSLIRLDARSRARIRVMTLSFTRISTSFHLAVDRA